MKITGQNYQLMKSSFANEQKKENSIKEKKSEQKDSKNINGATNNFDEMIEKIQEQIKKVNENSNYDEETKKAKLKELQDQIDEIKKLQELERTRKLEEAQAEKEEASKKKVEEKNKLENTTTVDESKDGDLLILSEDAKDIIKSDIKLDKLEQKDSIRKELKAEARLLENQIDIDQGRGVESEKKASQLEKLEDNIDTLNNEKKETVKVNNNKPAVPTDEENSKTSTEKNENIYENKEDK